MTDAAAGKLTGRKTIIGLADQMVLSLMGFAVMLILARTGDQSQLGLYAVANSFVVLLLSAQDSLVARPYAIQVFKPAGTPQQHANSSLLFSLAISAMASAAAVVVGIYSLPLSDAKSAVAFAIAAMVPCVLLREFGRRHGLSNLHMMSAFTVDAIAAGATTVLLLVLLALHSLTAVTGLLCIGAGAALAGLWWYTRSRQYFAPSGRELRPAFLQSWALGKWLFVSQSAMQMQGYVIHWICILVISASATGAYAAVLSVVALANPFLYGFFNLIMLKSVRTLKDGGTEGLKRQVLRDSIALGCIMAVFTVCIIFAGETVMNVLYPALDVQGQGPVLNILVLAAIAAAIGAFGGPAAIAVQGMEKAKELAAISLLVFAFGVLVSWYMITHYGLLGTGLALLATETVGTIARWALFLKLAGAK